MFKGGCGLLLILLACFVIYIMWWGKDRQGLTDTEQTAVYAMEQLMRETGSETKKREMQKAIDDLYKKSQRRDKERISEKESIGKDLDEASNAIKNNDLHRIVELCKNDYIREKYQNCSDYEDKLLIDSLNNNDNSLTYKLCSNYSISKRNKHCNDFLINQATGKFEERDYDGAMRICKDNVFLAGECCNIAEAEFDKLLKAGDAGGYDKLCKGILLECDSLWRKSCVDDVYKTIIKYKSAGK